MWDCARCTKHITNKRAKSCIKTVRWFLAGNHKNNGLQPIVPSRMVDSDWKEPCREQGAEAALFIWNYIMTLLLYGHMT